MIIEYAPEPFDMLIIKDTFSNNELEKIWAELSHLYHANCFLPPERTGGAKDDDGNYLKQNSAVFLDYIYQKRNFSSILPLLQEKLLSNEIKNKLIEKNDIFNNLNAVNQHATLISYYEDSDYYNPHFDASVLSTLTYIFKEPKNFNGGDISFYYKNNKFTINVENNLSIVFPSGYFHEVSSVNMIDQNILMSGRYCLSMFTGIQI